MSLASDEKTGLFEHFETIPSANDISFSGGDNYDRGSQKAISSSFQIHKYQKTDFRTGFSNSATETKVQQFSKHKLHYLL